MVFGGGQSWNDPVPVSISDYERVLQAGFADVEVVPIHEREFFAGRESFKAFLQVVPILEGIAIEGAPLDDALLDRYIAANSGRIVLYRNYYGLTARKPEK